MSDLPRRDEPQTGAPAKGDGCAKFLFGGLFVIVSLWFGWSMALVPAWNWWHARDWVATPCTITDSELVTQRGEDSTSYRADIGYQYRVGERTYFGEQFSHWNSSARSRDGGAIVALIERHPPQSRATCYVDPSDPTRAVLSQKFNRSTWGTLAGTLFMALLGVAILLARSQQVRPDARPQQLVTPQIAPDGTRVLASQSGSPWVSFVLFGGSALLINGFLIREAMQPWARQSQNWMVWAWLVLLGLPLLWFAVGAAAPLFNARPLLKSADLPVRAGQTSRFVLELRGGLMRVEMFVVTLEGREEATYSQGTDTITETQVFHFETLCVGGYSLAPTHFEVRLAPDAMHSLETPHNKIVWTLRLRGSVARWCEIKDEWILRVEPRQP